MLFGKKNLYLALLTSAVFYTVHPLEAAQKKICVSQCGSKQQTVQSQCGTQVVSRNSKLRKKHNNELVLLKEIHEAQKYFLSKFDGRKSSVTQAERDSLRKRIEDLPNYIKRSNDLFLDRLDSMDHIIYGIINGKEKYKNKKKITKPVQLLEEIQDKQRIYLIKQQKREIKKRLQ